MDEQPIKIGTLPDGRTAIARPHSRHGCPVLEIQPLNPKDEVIKIRYENNKDQG